jgi:hypothetical protein
VPTRQDEIEKLAALTLAPLVEVAWADGVVTAGERQGVIEAAKNIGIDQYSEFCRSTLRRWLNEPTPTEALAAWRQLLAPTLLEDTSRASRKSQVRLLDEARRIAKMDERPFEVGASLDARAGITAEEQRVLDQLEEALQRFTGAL